MPFELSDAFYASITIEDTNRVIYILSIFDEVGIIPAKISASIDGEIVFEFFHNGKYHSIELYVDGDIIFTIREKDIDSVTEVLNIYSIKNIIHQLFGFPEQLPCR